MAKTTYTQANRLIAVTTPLGEDALMLKGFQMRDEVGRPFVCELELRSADHTIKFDKIIGQNVTIRVQQTNGQTRYINGYVSRFSQEGAVSEGRINRYRATVVPWLWFLTRTADCRIFQNLSIPDVIRKIFNIFGFSDVDFQLTASYESREYVVQYRETAFNFISRLMEEEGIFYYFKHENGKHTLIVADGPSTHATVEGYAEVEYSQQEAQGATPKERVWDWRCEQTIQPGNYALRDFDFKAPDKLLDAEKATTAQKHEQKSFEIYDYPGFYEKKAEGDRYAAVRIEELDAAHEICHAVGDTRGLTVGAKFTLKGHGRQDQERAYVVTSAVYHAQTDEIGGRGAKGDGEQMYTVSFTAIPAAVTFRTQRTTPKPCISGPQTAIVAGPDGEEIFTDEFGRVKVRFHWDRLPEDDNIKPDATSCWIRVAQVWAGKKWGAMYIPRVGQEVVVEFLEGDPDRPLITGRVYNAQCSAPYKLPDNKTISTIKSSSSKGGDGFNELRFEDKKGDEQIFIHAQKQMDTRVKEDSYETIGRDRHLVVERDQIEHVKNNRSETIDNDHKETVKNDRNLKVEGKEAKEVVKSMSLKVGGDVAEEFDTNQSTLVKANHYLKAKNIVIEAEENITIKVTDDSFIAIDKDSITVKTKAFDLTATKDGIDIKAMKDITIKSDTGGLAAKVLKDMALEATKNFSAKGTAGIALESPATAALKGTATDVKGSAKLGLSGGIVMIN
jgi:type VI secretion system secreted protein VgrG